MFVKRLFFKHTVLDAEGIVRPGSRVHPKQVWVSYLNLKIAFKVMINKFMPTGLGSENIVAANAVQNVEWKEFPVTHKSTYPVCAEKVNKLICGIILL